MRAVGRSNPPSVWLRVRRVVLFLGAIYIVSVGLLWAFQRHLIYLPSGGPVAAPRGAPFESLQELRITTSDGVKLEAWYLPGMRTATVLVFHGNGGHRAHRVGLVRSLHRLGYGVLLPDYRGYGGSEGEPSESGLYADAEACLAWLRANAKGPHVFLGNSLGSGVAVELARRHAPAALVVRSGFDSLAAVGQGAYPFVPVGWLLRDEYASVDKMAAITCPCLVVHGEADRIIPIEHGRRLFDAANEPKRWVSIPGAGHNNLERFDGGGYWAELGRFLDDHLPTER